MHLMAAFDKKRCPGLRVGPVEVAENCDAQRFAYAESRVPRQPIEPLAGFAAPAAPRTRAITRCAVST
jgi:hypothetical protein